MSGKQNRIGRMGFLIVLMLAWCLACLVTLGGSLSEAASAERKRMENTLPGNCAACHEGEKVLPADHSPTKDMTLQDCRNCHNDGKLRGKLPLGHVHLLSGISCTGCHGDAKPQKALKTAQCLSCHESAEKLADKTAKLERNPHNSPHHGTSLDCDLCHHQHAKSENFCGQCHAWELKVP